MKTAVSSYSYEQYLGSGRMDLPEVIRLAARTGFEGIEFASPDLPAGKDPLAYATELRGLCQAEGIAVAGYAISGNFAADNLDDEVLRLCAEVDFARTLGAQVMRTDVMANFTTPFLTMEQCHRKIVPGIRRLADYARGQGVVLTTENHGVLFNESARLEQLLDWVDHSNFGILADIGNFMDAEEDSVVAVGRLARAIRHVHIKDFHLKDGGQFYPGEGWYMTRGGNYLRGAIVGHGDAPVLKCLKILEQAAYDGWLVLEFEGIEDATMATTMGLYNIRRMLQSLHLFRWNG